MNHIKIEMDDGDFGKRRINKSYYVSNKGESFDGRWTVKMHVGSNKDDQEYGVHSKKTFRVNKELDCFNGMTYMINGGRND